MRVAGRLEKATDRAALAAAVAGRGQGATWEAVGAALSFAGVIIGGDFENGRRTVQSDDGTTRTFKGPDLQDDRQPRWRLPRPGAPHRLTLAGSGLSCVVGVGHVTTGGPDAAGDRTARSRRVHAWR
ncbi:hypothetical protein GCM10010149_03510 [Nonomuraea roseoviolacea subsp. roseoviolacea]